MTAPLEMYDESLESLVIAALTQEGLQHRDEVGGQRYAPATVVDGQSGAGSFAILWGDDENLEIYRGDDLQRIDQRVFVIFRHSLAPKDKRKSQWRARQAAVKACNALMVNAELAFRGYRVTFIRRRPALINEANTLEQRAELSIVYDRGAL